MKQKKNILAKAFFAFIVFFSVFAPVTEVKAATLFSYSSNPGTSRKALYTFDKAYTNVVITYKGSYSGQVSPYTQVWAEVSCNGKTGTSNWPASEKTLDIGNVSSGTVVYGEASASDVGLNMTITGDVAHTHSWSTAWSYDANYHWHKCTGCSEITSKAAHSYT